MRKSIQSKENHRLQSATKRSERRAYAYTTLGGSCVKCGVPDDLHLDHVDPTSKVTSVSLLWTSSWIKFIDELHKCQLLCRRCHQNKTNIDNGWPLGHGTRANYTKRGCRCQECVKAFREYMKKFKIRGTSSGLDSGL